MVGLRERFIAAILAGNFADALASANEAKAHGLPFLYEEIVVNALSRVGQLWQDGKISVADEHVATAVAQTIATRSITKRRGRIAGPLPIAHDFGTWR